MANKRILVAPLNWGIGHATRCIPIVTALLENGFEPILASDGAALILLQKEFSKLKTEVLPSYNITYAENGASFRRKMISSLPRIRKVIAEEQKTTAQLVKKHEVIGIISDNRLGVRHPNVPSVIITHQLKVLTGKTTFLSTFMHQYYIKKFHQCWVPDFGDGKNLSGCLGHPKKSGKNIQYIGPLSRLRFFDLEKKYDILVMLSGPEPQREILEKILLRELKNLQKKIFFVRGVLEKRQICEKRGNMEVCNFLMAQQLEKAINSSELVIARSGYSTIMDLAKLEKKAFFIPTPGQYEQEYLARHFSKLKIAAFSEQADFTVKKLEELETYSGFSGFSFPGGLTAHFSLFQSK